MENGKRLPRGCEFIEMTRTPWRETRARVVCGNTLGPGGPREPYTAARSAELRDACAALGNFMREHGFADHATE